MAIEIPFVTPINLNRQEIRNAVVQVLSTAPAAQLGLFYYNSVLDTPGSFNSAGTFMPWDATKATNIPNAALTHASLTLGTTTVALGATSTVLAGMTSIASASFVGALTGNADTATKLATARTINGVSFDGTANIVLPATAWSTITGTPTTLSGYGITNALNTTASVLPVSANDLNTETLAGWYVQQTDAGAAAGVNYPSPLAGLLQVMVDSNGNLYQYYTVRSSGSIYWRGYLPSTWSTWKRVVEAAELSGYAPLTGTGASGTWAISVTGNAATATKLATARTIALSGSATGTATAFDGSANIAIAITSIDLTTVTSVLAVANGGTGVSTITGLVKGNGTAAMTAAVAGTDYIAPNTTPSLTQLNLSTDPASALQAATKQYVDNSVQAAASGLDPKDAVMAATTANITLSGVQTVDGVSLVAGDDILVKNQTTASQNGIYTVASGAWARRADAVQGTLTSGAMVLVLGGTVNLGTQWYLNTPDPITVGTTSLSWIQFGTTTVYSQGNGIVFTGTVISAKAGTGILVNTTGINVDPSVVTLKYAQNFGDGTSTSFAITHNLNTLDVNVSIRDNTTNQLVYASVTVNTVNQITIAVSITAPAVNAYRVIVTG